MGKRKMSDDAVDGSESKSLVVDGRVIDPTLASLFASSSGPVQVPTRPSRSHGGSLKSKTRLAEDMITRPVEQENTSKSSSEGGAEAVETTEQEETPRKRRKIGRKDDLEAAYMQRLAREEEKEHEQRPKTTANGVVGLRNVSGVEYDSDQEDAQSDEEHADLDSNDGETFGEDGNALPVHESIRKSSKETDKIMRTIFMSNVSTTAITSKNSRKTLLAHLKSVLDVKLNEKIESIRFRSTAFVSGVGPKRAAYAKKELMEETSRNTNAYAVLSSEAAARKVALNLNGSMVLDRHIHIDSFSNPTKTDNKRCVFVGNLPFVDEETKESPEDEGAGAKRKRPTARLPADAEEGLWRTFAKCGKIESVRVVRDKATRVGKGFAYVQFDDGNGVEKALELDGKRFPPLLPRTLRVMRAKRMQKKDAKVAGVRDGKAGGYRNGVREGGARRGKLNGVVFEGYRARTGANSVKVKTKSRGKKGVRPGGRSSRRGAVFKASGGKKKRDRE